ncbi:MAG TPA: ribosome recycling factor [Candidatus Taylorbacteria bacterium]|nr:MAG: Ribosome recycling factor [Parcubacteria group bacterium GW2011_GWA2_47_64]KKU97269.1 MAG: Ribosome recycling factor [Parcubacteria group bacterium GW2011_GWC2_48_17]HBV01772.1 ribosome recycling factor [Candidatus Taylorbacteria bacterium]
MSYSFSKLNERYKEVHDWLAKELASLRSGRAAPSVLDGVLVESYGSKMPIKHLATIALEDARTLRVSPFDAAVSKDIEKAIALTNLGLSVSLDDNGIRVHFPDLTSERRTALMKVAKEKLEAARINVRKARDETLKDIEEKVKQGGIGEDERFRLKKELEKMVESENKKLQEAFERKEKEISS